MIQPSGWVFFLMKWGCWGHWGHWGCWGCRVHGGCKGSKAWKITNDDCRVIQVPEFSFILMFWKQIFFFFDIFWVFYAFLVRMTAWTLHIKWFPWHKEPRWPQWPQQPQQPQWPQWPLQPNFIKNFYFKVKNVYLWWFGTFHCLKKALKVILNQFTLPF